MPACRGGPRTANPPYAGTGAGVATNVLVYGASGVDQTNYSERRFRLNLEQALRKVFTASSAAAFGGRVPVQLGARAVAPVPA